jgi:hypothetical protein
MRLLPPLLTWPCAIYGSKVAVHLGYRLHSIRSGGDCRIDVLDFERGRVALRKHNAVILAVPPDTTQALSPGIPALIVYRAIANFHDGVVPMTGCTSVTSVLNSMFNRLFVFDG